VQEETTTHDDGGWSHEKKEQINKALEQIRQDLVGTYQDVDFYDPFSRYKGGEELGSKGNVADFSGPQKIK
jgi:hypothetical protein